MRIIKKWIGRQPETAGEVRLLEVTQAEMFEQMYPLLGQLALHATSGHDVDFRLYFICEGGRRILPVHRVIVPRVQLAVLIVRCFGRYGAREHLAARVQRLGHAV